MDRVAGGGTADDPCPPAGRRRIGRPVSAVRRDLCDDVMRSGSDLFDGSRRSTGRDDHLLSLVPLPTLGLLHGLGAAGGRTGRPYGRRDRVLLGLIHTELARGWVRLEAAAAADRPLPPRLREVLGHLRSGDSEKQIATRMCLSPHTVHNHARRLYARFGATSRAELLSTDRQRPSAGGIRLGAGDR